MSNWNKILKSAKNEYASVVADGVLAGDVTDWFDTGSYAFNAVISGSLFKGIPEGKVTTLAAESATGKTFIALQTVKNFLEKYPNSACMYFESEGALTKEMIEERGIDSKRIFILPVVTVQEFRNQIFNILDAYAEDPEKGRLMCVLDSLGNLSTEKSQADAKSGNVAKDFTKASELKATFTSITLKLSKLKVPLVVTNHLYSTMDQYSPWEMSGGAALKYVGSTTIFLYKRKLKDSAGKIAGNDLRCKALKSRFTRENSEVNVALKYESGLDKYYGLLDLALQTGVFGKDSTRVVIPSGKKVFGKTIMDNPEEYFTQEVLEEIDKRLPKIFSYNYADETLPTIDDVESLETIEIKESDNENE